MKAIPWWSRWPERLQAEFDALNFAGIPFERDPSAEKDAIVRLKLQVTINHQVVPLVATFPDLYPYFRVEVQAPSLTLGHHQNPQYKNLCLLRRATVHWEEDETLAHLLQSQLSTVLETGTRPEMPVPGTEQVQAEPLAEFYPYFYPSLMLVDGQWTISAAERSGFLKIATIPPPGPVVRGAVMEILTNTRRSLCRLSDAVRALYSGPVITARWVRLNAPIHVFDPREFFGLVARADPGSNNNPITPFGIGFVQIWGALFPDEVHHREMGEGWAFVSHVEHERKAMRLPA